MDVRLHWPDQETVVVEHVQDVEPTLEANHLLRSEAQRSDWGRHIADIPNVLYVKWFNEYAQGDPKALMFSPEMDQFVQRKLNDPEWKKLRTDSAHVQGFMGFGS